MFNRHSPYWYLIPAAIGAIAWQTQASVNVQTLSPVANGSFMLTEDARGRFEAGPTEWDGSRFYFNGRYNYMDAPLVEYDSTRTHKIGNIVDGINTLDIGGGVFFRPGVAIGVNVPMNLVSPTGIGGQFTIGDTTLYGKFRLTSADSETHFSIMPEVFMPSGSHSLYLSNGAFGGGLLASLERDFGKDLTIAFNLGYRVNPGAREFDVDYTDMMPIAIGALYRVDSHWGINAEAAGAVALPLRAFNNPGDFYLGGRYQFSPGVSASGGVAFRAITDREDGHFRAVLGLNMSPEPAARMDRGGRDTIIIRHSSTEACGIRPYTASFSARPLTAEEMTQFATVLPYRPLRHNIKTLQIGQKSGLAQNGTPYVKDSQVLFAVDLTNLPPRQSIKKADSVAIKLDATKVSHDPYTKTEMICLLDRRICSGDVYEDPKWLADINPVFFHGHKPRNRAFSSQYLKTQLGTLGKERLYSSEITVEMDKILAGYGKSNDTMNVLYSGAPTDDVMPKKTLYFAVADDTYVGASETKLVVNMTEDTCTTLRLTQKSAKAKRTVGATVGKRFAPVARN